MTKSEIALKRLDSYIATRGYNFPGFLELSAIIFAPKTRRPPL